MASTGSVGPFFSATKALGACLSGTSILDVCPGMAPTKPSELGFVGFEGTELEGSSKIWVGFQSIQRRALKPTPQDSLRSGTTVARPVGQHRPGRREAI